MNLCQMASAKSDRLVEAVRLYDCTSDCTTVRRCYRIWLRILLPCVTIVMVHSRLTPLYNHSSREPVRAALPAAAAQSEVSTDRVPAAARGPASIHLSKFDGLPLLLRCCGPTIISSTMPFRRVERASRLSDSFLEFIALVRHRHLLRGRPLLPRREKVCGAARSRSGCRHPQWDGHHSAAMGTDGSATSEYGNFCNS